MSWTPEQIEQARELVRLLAPDTERGRAWLAQFEHDCDLVLAEVRASADGDG